MTNFKLEDFRTYIEIQKELDRLGTLYIKADSHLSSMGFTFEKAFLEEGSDGELWLTVSSSRWCCGEEDTEDRSILLSELLEPNYVENITRKIAEDKRRAEEAAAKAAARQKEQDLAAKRATFERLKAELGE